MAHLTYGDIDFKYSIWKVLPKADWKGKTEAAKREIPVPVWLTAKIQERQKERNASLTDWIFPNCDGKPNRHIENIVKRVAKRAGLSGRVDNISFVQPLSLAGFVTA